MLTEQPGRPDLPSSTLKRGQEPVQLLEVRAKVVDAAKGVCDRAQGAGRVTVELGKPPFEALELRTQDERAGSTFLREPSQFRLDDWALWIVQQPAKPFLQSRVELQPHLRHRGLGA